MSKFSINYGQLDNQITKRAIKLSEVKDQLEAVAFDIVRFKDSDTSAQLWQVQSADDGDYIVALYDEDELEKQASQSNPWKVSVSATNLEVSYKNDPLVKIASAKLGIPATELSQVKQYLPAKLASSPKLVKALLKELGPTALQEVFARYPELTKVVS